MLDKMRSVGYTREMTESEVDHYGFLGWMAIFGNDDEGPFPTQAQATLALDRMKAPPTPVARDMAVAEMNALRQENAEMAHELMTMKTALQGYASHSPLDMLKPAELQRDLRAIAGDPHTHVRSIGSDKCLTCGRDLRDSVHVRAQS